MSESPDRQRLDKWLWFARFIKTRTLAQALCEGGHVKLNGVSLGKSSTIKVGDELELTLAPYRKFVRVLGMGERRGPAPEARLLYEETREPERLGGFLSEFRPSGTGRPTKKERRQTERFKALIGNED